MPSGVATTAAAMAGSLLLAAGVAKVRGGAGLGQFLRAAGAGARTARAVRVVAPPAEGFVGAWLLSLRAPRAAAAVAMMLAGGFVVVLGVAMRRGVAEPCRCFGALDRAQPHGVSLARALLLLGAAATAFAAAAGASGDAGGAAAAWLLGVVLAASCVVGFALVGEAAAFRTGVRRVLAARAEGEHGGPAR